MKKILAVLAALCVMALPVAGLAEEAAETPMATQVEYAMANIEVSMNGQALDFTGYEYDGFITLDPDGTLFESTQHLVNDQIALAAEALMDSGILTIALRGVDGVYLTPALNVNVNELMEQYSQMLTGQMGGADIEAMINEYMGKALGVIGVVMGRLNQLEPEQTQIEGYTFCDGAVSDVTVTVYTLDPDTLNGIVKDVTEALEVQAPISFDGITLKVIGGSSADGRNVFCLELSNGQQSYSLEAEAFEADSTKTVYASVFADENPMGNLLAQVTMDGSHFAAQVALNAPAADLTFEFGIDGQTEEASFFGKVNCALQAQQNAFSFLADVYGKVSQIEYTAAAGADLKAMETADLMALTQDQEASNALVQQWAPALTESVNLLRQVPALNMILQTVQTALPTGETVAE